MACLSLSHIAYLTLVARSPIPPGQTLTYHIPTDLQSGTYWIHGHYDGQYVDGLRTPFVIHPLAPEPYSYDEEFTVVVADWYNDQHSTLMKKFLSTHSTYQKPPS